MATGAALSLEPCNVPDVKGGAYSTAFGDFPIDGFSTIGSGFCFSFTSETSREIRLPDDLGERVLPPKEAVPIPAALAAFDFTSDIILESQFPAIIHR